MKGIFLLSVLLFLPYVVFSQDFNEKTITPNVESPTSLHVADLNSDGNDDVIASGSGGIFWFDNVVDDYNFRNAIIDTLKNIHYIDLIDFNGDTHIDIVGHSADTEEFFWLENNGAASFTWHLISGSMPGVLAMKALDMDNDGDVDILYNIIGGGLYETYLFENTGSGFVPHVSYLARQLENLIYPIDFQSDGDFDLVVVKDYSPFSTDEIYVEINDGTNTFIELKIYEKTGSIKLTDVMHIDMDGNGIKDLVVADYTNKEIYWLSNTSSVRRDIISGISPRSFTVQDLNDDGIMDIAYSRYYSSSSHSYIVLQGSNPGASMSFTEVYSQSFDGQINHFTSLDIENDNDRDVIFLQKGDDMIISMVNQGSFDFNKLYIARNLDEPEWMVKADIDKDGDKDLVCVGNDVLYLLENMGNETYKTILLSTQIDGPYQVEVYDMNMDGNFDIITTSIGDDDLVIWENDGSLNFSRNAITSSPAELSNPMYFGIADFDGDNDPDIVVSASGMDFGNPVGLYWIENDGSGSYSSPIAIKDGFEYMRQVVAYDFDKDGDNDIVSTNTANGLRKARNNGNSTFSESAISTTLSSDRIKIADINGNGFMDFLVRSSDNTIEWFENSGMADFNFTQHTIDPEEVELVYFELIDYEQDGDMDIFFFTSTSGYTNIKSFKFGLFENDGSQNFTKKIFQENLYNITTAWVEDVDNDRDTDIYLGFSHANKIVFYENLQFQLEDPEITNWPATSAITFGETLSESNLIGGLFITPGSFAFANADQLLTAGSHQVTVKFTPDDSNSFKTLTSLVSIEVNKANPVVTQWPSAGSIVYPATLSTVVLSGGISNPEGTFGFVNPEAELSAGTFNVDVVFTANDVANYNQSFSTISVAVNKGVPVINNAPTASTITYGQILSESALTGGAASIAGGSFSFSNPDDMPQAGESSVDVTYSPADTDNYTIVTFSINITVDKADPAVFSWPASSSITYGNTLAVSTLTAGVADVNGVFSFADPTFSPNAGSYDADVIFQPDDLNYNSVMSQPGDVAVEVNPKSIQITANDQSKVYGETDPGFNWQITFGSMVDDDQLTGSLSRDPGEDADEYAITQGSLDAGSNYDLDFLDALFTINPRTITVEGSFTVENKIFDGTGDAVILDNNLVLVSILDGDDLQLEPNAQFTSADPGENIPVELSNGTVLSGASKENYLVSLEGAPTAYATIIPVATNVPATDSQNIKPVVYPNPFREVLNFDHIQNSRSITVIDVSGSVVWHSENVEKTKDVSQLVNGIYFIRITQNNGVSYTHKLIKE